MSNARGLFIFNETMAGMQLSITALHLSSGSTPALSPAAQAARGLPLLSLGGSASAPLSRSINPNRSVHPAVIAAAAAAALATMARVRLVTPFRNVPVPGPKKRSVQMSKGQFGAIMNGREVRCGCKVFQQQCVPAKVERVL